MQLEGRFRSRLRDGVYVMHKFAANVASNVKLEINLFNIINKWIYNMNVGVGRKKYGG